MVKLRKFITFEGKGLVLLHFLLCVLFIGGINAQTPKQLKFYSERIEFGSDEVKRNALHDLRNFQTESASRIAIPALKDSLDVIRATATHTIIYLPKEESAKHLIPLLNDKSHFVRRETAYALGKTKNTDTAGVLIDLLDKEKKQNVKDAIAVALGLIGNRIGILPLTNILTKKPKKKHKFYRRAAARSIGQIVESIKQKQTTLITPHSFLPQNYKEVDPNNENKIKPSQMFLKVVSVLSNTLLNSKESQDVRRESAFSLGVIGNKSSIKILNTHLNSEDIYLAEICKEALLKIK